MKFATTVLADLICGPVSGIIESLDTWIAAALKPYSYSRKRTTTTKSVYSCVQNTFIIALENGKVITFTLRTYTQDYIGYYVYLSYPEEDYFLSTLLRFFVSEGFHFNEIRKQIPLTSEEMVFTDQFFIP